MLVVVGGHTRNIGKTTLSTQVIAAFPAMRWTAMKITQYGHGICSANGEACDCATADHTVAVSEERKPDSGTDTSRMLVAGAARVLWVRTQQGDLAAGSLSEAMPRLRKEIAAAENVLIESNSILRFLRPDTYLAVLDPTVADFKPSALRYLDRADALFVPDGVDLREATWKGIAPSVYRGKPVFELREESLLPDAVAWLTARVADDRKLYQRQRQAV
jgi:molybdopterin-guanine dinucleotide biosynthesis protein